MLYHQLMQQHGFDKPIWITETNVIPYDDPVNANTPNGTAAQMRSTLREQANYMLEAIAMGLAACVPKIEVYKMKDGDGDVVNGEALVRADYSKRPEYYAFQVAAQYFTDFRSATLFAPGDLREVVFDRGASRVTVLWDAAPTPISVLLPAAGSGQAQQGGPRGNFEAVSAGAGGFALSLPGATMHTDLTNPSAYLIGGSPVVLVENGVSGAVSAATNLSAATLPPFRPIAARVAGQLGSGNLPDASLPAAAPAKTFNAPSGCTFVLGFQTVAALIPQTVGTCADDEQHSPSNGDALQLTSGGLLVWRKADNWTAFTDGYHTWVNGPAGLQERLNTQRFTFEANPSGLPTVH
ncbi:MAG TPA: hypothetical protein VGP33_00340, partial [Chloroflexota bacterium]|nr:hypothetical protein [Chloroflexota bacterium]